MNIKNTQLCFVSCSVKNYAPKTIYGGLNLWFIKFLDLQKMLFHAPENIINIPLCFMSPKVVLFSVSKIQQTTVCTCLLLKLKENISSECKIFLKYSKEHVPRNLQPDITFGAYVTLNYSETSL